MGLLMKLKIRIKWFLYILTHGYMSKHEWTIYQYIDSINEFENSKSKSLRLFRLHVLQKIRQHLHTNGYITFKDILKYENPYMHLINDGIAELKNIKGESNE